MKTCLRVQKISEMGFNMQDFIDKVLLGARKGYLEHNILPSLTIAQAILESNSGKSQLAIKGNNLFGIKADSRWTGKKINFPTKEFIKGKEITVNAYFRAYDSFSDSVEDHTKFLLTKRYEKVRSAKDYKEAAHEISKANYATDPDYPGKLIKIIEQYKLYQYDEEGEVLINRNKILEAALMLQSKGVKYRLGAKAVPPSIPKELDCSGFVRYCYLYAGANVKDGTYYQFNNSNSIKHADLRVGDLGFMQTPDSPGTNHVGIYAGDGKWIHCNFSRNGITLEKTNIFPYARRFKGISFTNKIEEGKKMEERKPVTEKDLSYGIAAINNLAKLKIINSPERHIKDLREYPWDWKMWVVQNNIAEKCKGE